MNSEELVDPDEVLSFLEKIHGLSSLAPEELQKLLYARRFELLGALNTSDTEAAKSESKDMLPEYDTIPSTRELHHALLGGLIPNGYQCVAHVLYPDSVPWPARKGPTAASEEPVPAADAGAPATPEALPSSSSSAPAAPAAAGAKRSHSKPDPAAAASGQNKQAEADDSSNRPPEEAPGIVIKKPQDSCEPVTLRKRPMGGLREPPGKQDSVPFTLCGQKLSSTVRGKPVVEQGEDLLTVYVKEVEDGGNLCIAARDEVVRLERAVKLEQYQEKKLLERIQHLEIARKAEEEHQQLIRKREADRQARKVELKNVLEEAWSIKLRKEREQQEEAKQQKEKEVAERKAWQEHHEEQKQVVRDWYEKKGRRESAGEEGLAMKEPKQLAKEQALEQERQRKSRPKTVKAQLADERIHRLQQALEQRPPLPPRQHDLARPAALVERRPDSPDSAAGLTAPTQAAKQGPVSWTREAKMVSDAYGLTPRDCTAVEKSFVRNVHGAGRMARYEKV